jgi:outer membrane protein assembly factor BamB
MKHRRTTRLLVVVVLLVALAALGGGLRAVFARDARARDVAAPNAPVPIPTAAPAVARAPDPDVRWVNPVRGEPDGVTISGSDVATVEFDAVRLLDLGTGTARWRVEITGLARARAAFTANRVIVASRDQVVLLDRATGRRVGSTPFTDAQHLVVTTAGGRDVVVAANLAGDVAGVDVAAATSLWSRSYAGSVVDPPAADAGVVVANWDVGSDTAMRVLAAATGDVVWDLAVGAASTPPAAAGGRVFVAAGDTEREAVFVALDAATGRPLWGGAFPAPWDQSAAPVVADDTVYLLDRVGTVTAVDVGSGQPRWQTRTHTSVLYARMVANATRVIFQTFDDHVVALDRTTGKVVSGTSEDAFPIDVDATDDALVVALRRGAPSRIEARPAP